MPIASLLGRAIGYSIAEVQWYIERSATPLGMATIGAIAYQIAVDVAEDHTIDHQDADAVTQNVFDCLQYLD